MSRECTQEDAKAHACSYNLIVLLKRMDREEPALIDELLAGVEGDKEAAQLQQANAYRRKSRDPLDGNDDAQQ